MLTILWVIWSLWILQALYCVFNIWAYRSKMRRQDEALWAPPMGPEPQALLMAPMKGVSHNFDAFVKGLLNQDYGSYHLVFSVESERDPVYAALLDRLGFSDDRLAWDRSESSPSVGMGKVAAGLHAVRLNVAGLSDFGAQKVNNQLSALRFLRPEDQYIATCDADIVPYLYMLRTLLRPLIQETHQAATGYRWLIPQHRNLGMDVGTIMNASVATMGGPEFCNLMWGGAHAVSREVHENIRLSDRFQGAFNDDLQTSHYVRKAGYRIAYIRSLMLPSPESYPWVDMLRFARRQYFHVRVYAPWAWWVALYGTTCYTVGMVSSLAALMYGYAPALLPVAVVAAANQVRAGQRIRLVRALFSGDDLKNLKPTFLVERLGTSLCMLVHFAVVLSSRFGRRISWSGITYEVTGRQQAVVVARDGRDEEFSENAVRGTPT